MLLSAGKFPSQTEWQPYGHLICTPVSLLIGTTCLHARGELSVQCVKEIMQLSHALYADHFAERGLPLKIQELLPYIPQHLFQYVETAGTIVRGREEEPLAVEGMIIKVLDEQLQASGCIGGPWVGR